MCKSIMKTLIILLLGNYFNCSANPLQVGTTNPNLDIEQVPSGETVTLLCRSNDENHNFLYWHVLGKNIIVGPTNAYNKGKFNYEVLSGNLTIRSVTKNEDGLYDCVSRGVKNDAFNIRTVRMVVTKDWEDVYEHDPGVNTFRIVVIIGSLMVLSAIGYVIYRVYRNRYQNPGYLLQSEDEEDDDDSAEELFRTPGTSTSTRSGGTAGGSGGNIVLGNFTESFGEPGISTDFKSILDNRNNK